MQDIHIIILQVTPGNKLSKNAEADADADPNIVESWSIQTDSGLVEC